MKQVEILTLDEALLQKARGKDLRPRKRRGAGGYGGRLAAVVERQITYATPEQQKGFEEKRQRELKYKKIWDRSGSREDFPKWYKKKYGKEFS